MLISSGIHKQSNSIAWLRAGACVAHFFHFVVAAWASVSRCASEAHCSCTNEYNLVFYFHLPLPWVRPAKPRPRENAGFQLNRAEVEPGSCLGFPTCLTLTIGKALLKEEKATEIAISALAKSVVNVEADDL